MKTRTKRLLSMLLVLTMVLALLPATSFADESQTATSEAAITGESPEKPAEGAGEAAVPDSNDDAAPDDSGEDEIMLLGGAPEDYEFDSSTGAMVVKTADGVTAWEGTVNPDSIITLTVKDTITVIPGNAFTGLKNLESLTFDGAIEIEGGDYADGTPVAPFAYTSKLAEIHFGGAAKINGYAFYVNAYSQNTALQELVFPAGSTVANKTIFAGYTALESVTFKGDITIGGGNFYSCPALKTLIFEGESIVKDDAFTLCPALETLTFTKKTDLRDNAFSLMTSSNNVLKELVFPAGSTVAGGLLFEGYNALESVTFKGEITIGSCDFINCPALKILVFEGDSTVQGMAFSNCPALESLIFMGKTDIKDGAFSTSSGSPNNALKELVFPAGSTVAAGAFFSGYTALESVTFEGDITIGGGNFGYCPALKTLVFEGESVVGGSSFSSCPALENLSFGKKTAIKDGVFSTSSGSPNNALKELVFPAGSTVAAGAFFSGYTALESVTFEGDITIGGGNFGYCPALKTLVFEGESVVGGGSFSSCHALENLIFGKKTAIKDGVFLSGNGHVKELVFPAGSTVADGAFFSGYTALESVTFKGDITIGGSDFNDCTSLGAIVFEGKSVVKGVAFVDNPALETIIFEEDAEIQEEAFKNCPALASVTFKKNAVLSKDTFGTVEPSGSHSVADNVMAIEFGTETPPAFPGEMFNLLKPENVTISVPCGCSEAYQAELSKDNGSDPAVTYNIAYVNSVMGPVHSWGSTDATSHTCTSCGKVEKHVFVGNVCKDCGYAYQYEFIKGMNGIYTKGSGKDLEFTANGQKDDCTGIKIDGTLIDAKHYTLVSGSTIITLKNTYLETLSEGEHAVTVVYGAAEAEADFKVVAATVEPNPGTSGVEPVKPGTSGVEPVKPGTSGQTAAKPLTPTKGTSTADKTGGPKTGDHNQMILWMLLMFTACGGLGIASYGRKKGVSEK